MATNDEDSRSRLPLLEFPPRPATNRLRIRPQTQPQSPGPTYTFLLGVNASL
jgi:hypothetical protein